MSDKGESAEVKEVSAETKEVKCAKCGCFKKIVKFCLWAFLVCVVLDVLAILSTPLWVGPVCKSVAEAVTPKVTGTDFKVAEISVNPFTGVLLVRDLHLANPKGYSIDDCFSVQTLRVDIAVSKLSSTFAEVEKIEIRGLRASYISNGGITSMGTNNVDAILANVDKFLGTKEGEEEQPAEAEEPVAEEAEAGKEFKVVIDRFEISDTKVYKGAAIVDVPIVLPPITLNDIGKASGGVSLVNAGKEIYESVMGGVSKVGGSLKDGFNATKDFFGSFKKDKSEE